MTPGSDGLLREKPWAEKAAHPGEPYGDSGVHPAFLMAPKLLSVGVGALHYRCLTDSKENPGKLSDVQAHQDVTFKQGFSHHIYLLWSLFYFTYMTGFGPDSSVLN